MLLSDLQDHQRIERNARTVDDLWAGGCRSAEVPADEDTAFGVRLRVARVEEYIRVSWNASDLESLKIRLHAMKPMHAAIANVAAWWKFRPPQLRLSVTVWIRVLNAGREFMTIFVE